MAATDGTLVMGVLSGDKAAFAELYDRKARLIRAVCFDTTHDLETAAELTQETFLRAYIKLESLRDPQRFAPWLVGISRQVCREWRRRRRRDQRIRDLPDNLVAPRDSEPDERISLLRDALGALPARERLGLHAFYLQDLDAEQARTVLGLSRSGLYRLLSSARERVRRLLQPKEVRS